MKIAVVRPAMFGVPASDALMPLFFAIARALAAPQDSMAFYDERVQALPEHFSEDVLLLTVETFSACRAYQIADAQRAAGKTVLMGGFHPSMCPEECLQHADAVLTGDAEDTLPQALRDCACGTLQKRYDSRGEFDLAALTYDYSVFTHRRYRLIGLVQFCRGCRFSCDFCSVHAFYPGRARFRPVPLVLQEIRQMHQKYLFFVDDNLFSDRERMEELLEGLRPLRKRWVCQISMDVAREPELLRRMVQSGCRMVIIGFESLSRENLRQMGKSANLAENGYETAIENLHRAGLMIYGTFVIGYDADTADTAQKLAEFAEEHRFAIANFNPLMPMPGTPLYDRLRAENRLPYPQWWIDPSYHYGDAQIVPRRMSGDELMESCRAARFRFYSGKSIRRRMHGANTHSAGNLFLYLATNLISGREIHFKQGRRLGKTDEDYTH